MMEDSTQPLSISTATLFSHLDSVQLRKQWSSLLSILFRPSTLAIVFILYLILVRRLHYQRLSALRAAYPPSTFPSLSLADAQSTVQSMGQLEFPFMLEKGFQFGLFRTYGIPSICSTLISTARMTSQRISPKRYADTIALVSTFVVNPMGDEKWVKGIARLNCIHGHYQEGGSGKARILDEDMLFTLGRLAEQPVTWIESCEWRPLDPVEICALGVFWKAIGHTMGISYDPLPSSATGWKHGAHFLWELADYSEKYEQKVMLPAEVCHRLGVQTTGILLTEVPSWAKEWARKAVGGLLDDRILTAMLLPIPSATTRFVVNFFVQLRKLFLRHLCLPRPHFLRMEIITSDADKNFAQSYDADPWYVKPTLLSRWNLRAWIRRAQGLPLPGDEGNRYCPMGFTMGDIGPKIGRGQQGEAEETLRERMRAQMHGDRLVMLG